MIIILYYLDTLFTIICPLDVKVNRQTYILSRKCTLRATVMFLFVLLRFHHFTFYLSSLRPIATRCTNISSDRPAI